MDQALIVSPPYIHKPTALIHFERKLSVIAQKVMTLIVAHCQKATKNAQGFYFIEKQKVCEFLGWEESHNQPRIVEAFREIFNNTLVWNMFGEDRTFKRLECKLIVALLVPTETGCFMGFALYPLLEPVILSPKVFGQILFEAPALLTRSEYAFPLYELLADHISRDDGLLRIGLADLKRYLGLKGRYSDFTLFVVRVLTPSVDSINANTDLQISYETWRTGRGVGGLVFRVKRQSQLTMPVKTAVKTLVALSPPPPLPTPISWSTEEQAFLDRLARHQISAEDAIQALQTHGLDGAREIYGYVRQEVMRRKGTAEEIRNGAAYLARCLREGYGRKGDLDREADIAQAQQAEQAAAAQSAARSAKAEANAATRTQTAAVMERFTALPAADQTALERAFLEAEPIWAGRPASSMSRSKAFQRWLAGSDGLIKESAGLINSSI
ncbi:MAG: RepB family plasmid replication initiator protein [Candidatus Competibacteraceae bacterium]|nr:MAG: RepB family plasmid replication initiator protein [Candidatus Competibacteraceae bacterium]